ncbi:MAG: hypothetical protein ACOCP8_09545 [archaeon]
MEKNKTLSSVDKAKFKIDKSAKNHVKKVMKRNNSLLKRLKDL